VAFFVSGKTYLSKYPSIYMIDISNGNLVKRIYLDAEPKGIEGVPSGQPSAVDSDGNGYIDRIYIGTNKGYLYKVDIPDNLTGAGNITNCVINTDYSDNFGNSVALGQQYHPIYASPTVIVQNTYDSQGKVVEYKTSILFGTGDSPYYNDNINTNDTTYHFFAYVDKAAKGDCSSGKVSLDWVYALPAGERIFATAFAAAKTVYFGTSTAETEDPCEGSGIVGANLGTMRAMDINQTGPVTVKFAKTTGNIVSSPVVDDNHLYVKTTGGGLQTTQGPFNNPAAMAGLVDSAVATWREIYDQNEPLR
jgi:type IV pilus assembly protein PilY1